MNLPALTMLPSWSIGKSADLTSIAAIPSTKGLILSAPKRLSSSAKPMAGWRPKVTITSNICVFSVSLRGVK